MRVLFLGSPEFAVPSLNALNESSRFELCAVITQPDRRAGRGQRLREPPVKSVATELGIPVFQFQSIRKDPEAQALLADLQPDVMVVVAFGQILPAEFIYYPPHGTLNVHASLLPKYRGAAPIAHAILNGEAETGITIMKIDAGMDTGDLLSKRVISVPADATTGELEIQLSREGASLLLETIGGYVDGKILPVPQDEAEATYAPRIKKDDGRIRWDQPAVAIHNRVRALNPWPGAISTWREQSVKIWKTEVGQEVEETGLNEVPGTVVQATNGRLLVSCRGTACLSVLSLQLPNRKRVSSAEFVNGWQLEVGERFS
jgi:methionyl-tRNA formyltransferase